MKRIFELAAGWAILGGICYSIYAFSGKKENSSYTISVSCAEVKFFDPSIKNMRIYFGSVKHYGDSIVSFSISKSGSVFDESILEGHILDENDISEITTKLGIHYHVHLLKDGSCGNTKDMNDLISEPKDEEPEYEPEDPY